MSAGKVMEEPPDISDTFSGPIVVVKIGPEGKPYRIHKLLITHYSGYFRGALGSENFKEGMSGEATLEDVSAWVFDRFVAWLYAHYFADPTCTQWYKSCSLAGTNGFNLAELYVFADRFIIPNFEQAITHAAVEYFNNASRSSIMNEYFCHAINYAYETLPEGHLFRMLLVDVFHANWIPGDLVEKNTELPTKFMLRVLTKSSKLFNTTPRPRLSIHAYINRQNI